MKAMCHECDFLRIISQLYLADFLARSMLAINVEVGRQCWQSGVVLARKTCQEMPACAYNGGAPVVPSSIAGNELKFLGRTSGKQKEEKNHEIDSCRSTATAVVPVFSYHMPCATRCDAAGACIQQHPEQFQQYLSCFLDRCKCGLRRLPSFYD
jgi:hypothetical protein